jgi:PIN domain nuclease of toxin-antitoxin system
VRLLLDTHALLWWLSDDPPDLSDVARSAIRGEGTFVAVSAASVWEMSIKSSIGKLRLPEQLDAALEGEHFTPLAVTLPHALRAGELPRHHGDPFDRMLIAQAQLEQLTIVTRDSRFSLYDVDVLAA